MSGRDDFKQTFQLNPLVMNGGIASAIPGGMLAIGNLSQSVDFPTGILGAGFFGSDDEYNFHFHPLPGSTVIDNDISHYPFANQTVAANALIAKPLTVSLLMHVVAKGSMDYWTKLSVVTGLIETFKQHNTQGGTYTIATPSYFWTPCVFLRMIEASSEESGQPQNAWILEFERPLLTLEEAQSTQNTLMSKLSNGQQIQGQPTWSGTQPGGQNPLITPQMIPGASGAGGAGVAALSESSPPVPFA